MNLSDLKTILDNNYHSSEQSFSLAASQLNSDAVSNLMEKVLQVETLTLSEAKEPPSEANANISLSGKITLTVYDFSAVPAQAVFFLDKQGSPQLSLMVDLTNVPTWAFKQAFAQFADTFFEDLVLSADASANPALLFASTALDKANWGESLQAGLSFHAVFPTFSGLQIRFTLLLTRQFDSSWTELGLALKGTFPLGERSVTVSTFLSQKTIGVVKFRGEFDNMSLPGPSELLKLLGGEEAPTDYLPDQYPASDQISLKALGFGLGLRVKNITDVWLELETLQGAGWEIIPDWLTLKNVTAVFVVYDPFEKTRSLHCIIYAELDVPSTDPVFQLEVSGRFPDYIIQGYLVEDTTVDLAALLQKFLPGVGGLPTNLEITELNFTADPTQSSYAFYLDIQGEWQIISDFTLQELDLTLQYGPGPDAAVSGAIAAYVQLGGVDLMIAADHPAADAGWQFTGNTEAGDDIPIGLLVTDLATQLGATASAVPSLLADLVLDYLEISFDTQTKNFHFSGEARLPLDDGQEVIYLTLTIDKQASEDALNLDVKLIIVLADDQELEFEVELAQTGPGEDAGPASRVLIATYTGSDNQVEVKQLVQAISSTLGDLVPAGIQLKDVVLALIQEETSPSSNGQRAEGDTNKTKFLFGLDIGADIDLSDLPVVGSALTEVQLNNLRLLAASAALTRAEVETINQWLPDGISPLSLPAQAETGNGSTPTQPATALQKGLTLSAQVAFGSDETYTLLLPSRNTSTNSTNGDSGSSPDSGQSGDSAPADPATTPTDWTKTQKDVGPVSFSKIGLAYQDEVLSFVFSVTLAKSGLTFSLDGLSIGSRLDEFSPQFNLRGLGLNYQKTGLEIGGAFLHQTVTREGETYDEYDGLVVIKTTKLSLSALGSYAYYKGHPSLFIYGVLGYPLGGPPFFFVTGLAAGFGYNRQLIIPPIEQVPDFPLISAATNPPAPPQKPDDLRAQLDLLREYIPPSSGDIFLAVGLKFTSFEIIDSFVLVTISFGHRFELDILGLSTLIVPTPEAGKTVSPLAEVQLALRASFIPDEGFLGVLAQLTSASYILSKDCHLTGGFAFYGWFSGPHGGDFVNTLGGYHPNFKPPAHYPQVPRLGFNWKVDSAITLKGEVYYALCAHALMAGGLLEATYNSGALQAWFKAGADFLISWKPYHYEAHIYVDIGGKLGFIEVDLGADLQIAGPEFGGKAEIHVFIFTVNISFGSDAPTPSPISWSEFKTSFLPSDDKICSLSITEGLTKAMGGDKSKQPDAVEHWIIDPKYLSIATNAVIPTKTASAGADDITLDQADTSFGIGSMDLAAGGLTTSQTITITRDGAKCEDDFAYTPILKKAPAGLWGQALTPQLNEARFIENTVAGFEIKPAQPPTPGETHAIDRRHLQYETEAIGEAYAWQDLTVFNPDGADEQARRATIEQTLQSSSAARDTLLTSLGFQTSDVALDPSLADAFIVAPQVAEALGLHQ